MHKDVENYTGFIDDMKSLDNKKLLDEFHFMCRSINVASEEEGDKMNILKHMIWSRMQ